MSAACGMLGNPDPACLRRMTAALKHRCNLFHYVETDGYGVAAGHPLGGPLCLVDGTPRGMDGRPLGANELTTIAKATLQAAALEVRGSFAAVVQRPDGEWWLFRDRLGAKPLYYHIHEHGLLFASELKALMASGMVEKHLDLLQVDHFLTLRCVPGPASIIKGVNRVRPGHVLAYRDGHTEEVAFAAFDLDPEQQTKEQAGKRFRELFEQAVDRADVHTLLWSAGVDSAAIGALRPEARRIHVSLERAWQHEGRMARDSARLLGNPAQIEVGPHFSEDSFSQVARCLDEPLADMSVMPLWLVLERAAEFSDRLISGHGADELLGGYPRNHLLKRAQGAQHLVPVSLLTGILPALPPNAFVRRGSHYLHAIRDPSQAYLALIAVFDPGERRDLYTTAMKSALLDQGGPAALVADHFKESDLTRNVLSLDLGVGLPGMLLTKWDRIAAAHGATVVSPYLDDDLVDFVLRLPPEIRFGVRSKPLLRYALRDVLPARVRLRARRSFKEPQEGRIARTIETITRRIVTQERVEASGLFKWRYVDQVLRSASHNVFRRRQFWALLSFFSWYRAHMED